jgi:hypothetical protein
MLSRGSWISLPASLSSVLTDVDGRGTDLGVFLAAADLLVLRDGAAWCWCCRLSTAGPARATGRRPCDVVIACRCHCCSSAFGDGELPHLGLAHQYLNHFRCKSEYEELLSRTALPVGVRKGMVDAMGNSQAGPVVLGPNTCMDLPADASFEFVEIRARSLAEHRAWLQILDDTMRRDGLLWEEITTRYGEGLSIEAALRRQRGSHAQALLLMLPTLANWSRDPQLSGQGSGFTAALERG